MSVESRKLERRPPPIRTPSHSPPPPLHLLLDYPRSSPVRAAPDRNTPKPTWEATLSDLSRGLQLICGSPPSTGGPGSLSPGRYHHHPLASPSPAAFPFGGEGGNGSSLSPPLASSSSSSGPRKAFLRELQRANSVQGHGPRPNQRPIFVRHIETQAELRNRLVEICRTGTNGDHRTRRTGSPVLSTAHALTTRPSLFPVVTPLDPRPHRRPSPLVRVNVAPHRPEELIASVDGKRHLVIEAISGSGKVLYSSTLPGVTQVKNLVVEMHENGVLWVRERSPGIAEVMFNNTGSAFIPIVRQDESNRDLVIVLHVPRCFRFEDLSVQTVDDRVIVMGKKRCLPPGVAINFRSKGGSVLPTLRVSLRLPLGADSRSISASLTRHHQLVIRGTLGPTARRSTF